MALVFRPPGSGGVRRGCRTQFPLDGADGVDDRLSEGGGDGRSLDGLVVLEEWSGEVGFQASEMFADGGVVEAEGFSRCGQVGMFGDSRQGGEAFPGARAGECLRRYKFMTTQWAMSTKRL
jgi:hypothetical protein